jgi:hypothetical protein
MEMALLRTGNIARKFLDGHVTIWLPCLEEFLAAWPKSLQLSPEDEGTTEQHAAVQDTEQKRTYRISKWCCKVISTHSLPAG